MLNEYTLDKIITLTSEQRKKCKLDDDKWEIMQRFHDYYHITNDKENNSDKLYHIKGIGKWTIDCAKIMTADYSCGFITGDLAVRKELSRVLGLTRTLTPNETKQLMEINFDTHGAGLIFSKIWNKTRFR